MLDAIWVYGGDTIGREEKIEEDMYMCESDFRARGRQRVTRPRAGAYRMTKGTTSGALHPPSPRPRHRAYSAPGAARASPPS